MEPYVFHCTPCGKAHAGECPPREVSGSTRGNDVLQAALDAAVAGLDKSAQDWSGHVPTSPLPHVDRSSQVPWSVGDVVASMTPFHPGLVFLVVGDINPLSWYHECELLAGSWLGYGLGANKRGLIGRDSLYGQYSRVIG